MKTNYVILCWWWFLVWCTCCRAQVAVCYDYLSESRLTDEQGNGYGSGSLMLLSMVYFSWRNAGRYELTVDISNSMKVSVATRLGKRWKLELAALDMDGMSAVMQVEGKSKRRLSMLPFSTVKTS